MKLHNSLSVTYETQILEKGRVVMQRPPKKNLILDGGLDLFASNRSDRLTAYCALGDGTKPTKRDSGAITISIISEEASASANFFEPGDVGRLLKLDSGQECYITGFNSATSVSVSGASDDAASEGTIWYVNEAGHFNELSRTNSLSNDSGANEVNFDGTTLEIKRTFIFPEETEARTYREIGWSPNASGQLFGRDLIFGGGDSISPGQQYKVIVRLKIGPNPVVPTAQPNVGGSFNTEGEAMITDMLVDFDGVNGGLGGAREIEPSTVKTIFPMSSVLTLPSVAISSNSPTDTPNVGTRGSPVKNISGNSYLSGSFERTFVAVFEVNEANLTWAGFGIGNGSQNWQGRCAFIHKFTNPQTKDSNHRLTLSFKISWGRTLEN